MTFYLYVAAIYFAWLIYQMLMDRNCSNWDLGCWITIAIATLLWVIVIPVSILEIFSKDKVRWQTTELLPESEDTRSSVHFETLLSE